jgi:hypothetical protein
MENATLGSGHFVAETGVGPPAEARGANQGGAGARVLREIIRTPAFLEIIKSNSKGLDPEDARELVRTFVWEDVELSLSLVGNIPEIINYLAAAVLELGTQMNNFPGGLLDQFVMQVGSGIDLEVLNQYPAVFGPLLENIGFAELAAAALGSAVNAGADVIVKAVEKNPDLLRDTLGQVEGRKLLRAAFALARSAVRWVVSGITGLAGRRAGGVADTI